MYLEHFGLKEYPFRLTPDLDFLYMSNAHAQAKAYMDYSVWNREGFVVITGEIGCGKTTLIQKLISELDDENVVVAKLFQTQLDDVEFLQAVLVEFGFNPFGAKKVELIDMLNTFLIDNFHNEKQTLLIVDEAHNLTMQALEEVRMLSGLETRKEKILHVILVGQPQLNELLDSPEMEQMNQRVRLRFHLKPLSEADAEQYIAHRLKIAGAERDDIFDAGSVPKVYEYTGGIPRLINTLCDTALTVAYADGLKTVTKEIVGVAAEELQWLPHAKRINAKRHKDNAGRSRKQSAGSGDLDRRLASFDRRLGRLDSLVPELNAIAERAGGIETLLRQILDVLKKDESAPVPQKKKNQQGR